MSQAATNAYGVAMRPSPACSPPSGPQPRSSSAITSTAKSAYFSGVLLTTTTCAKQRAQDAERAGEDGLAVDAQEGLVAPAHAAVATAGQDHPGHAKC